MRKIVQCNIIFLAVAFGLAGIAAPSLAEEPAIEATAAPRWHPVDASTGQIADVDELRTLVEAFPNSSSVRLRLLNAYIADEQFGQALAVAEQLAAEGYAFSSTAREFLQGLVLTGLMPPWLALNELNADPIADSAVVATLPQEALLPEGLAVLGEGTYAVTTVVSQRVWFNDGDEWRPSRDLGTGNLSGIRADSSGIVVASADLGMLPEGAKPFFGLFAVEHGFAPMMIAAPDGVQLSDIAFFSDDILYASDPIGGGVYEIESIGDGVEVLVPPGTLRSPQGIAPGEDGSRLYVSDYRYGLAIVETDSGEVSRLVADEPMLLDGIDGLWLHEGELIGVQNGISPMRILALKLSGDGNRITAMRVLERANPEWTEPLGGDIHEGALYYIGNGSWDLFEDGGTLREGAQLRPTQVRRLELAENPPD